MNSSQMQIKLISEPEFRRLEELSDNFYCHLCNQRLPIISDSFFDQSDLGNETFQQTLHRMTAYTVRVISLRTKQQQTTHMIGHVTPKIAPPMILFFELQSLRRKTDKT